MGVILSPRPSCAPLTPEEDCGLGLPARFFLEIEGVFISSRFFLENMVEPVPWPQVWAAGLGLSTLQFLGLAGSGPHCSGPPPPQLSDPRDGPGPHWCAKSPTQEKAPSRQREEGGDTVDPPPV